MPDLTLEQPHMFDDVVACAESGVLHVKNVFYVDGPAGAGKTFLNKELPHYPRAKGCVVLIVAISGIAALLLPGGRAAHSRFRLFVPLPLEGAMASIVANSGTA